MARYQTIPDLTSLNLNPPLNLQVGERVQVNFEAGPAMLIEYPTKKTAPTIPEQIGLNPGEPRLQESFVINAGESVVVNFTDGESLLIERLDKYTPSTIPKEK